jgi:hypothetical protein
MGMWIAPLLLGLAGQDAAPLDWLVGEWCTDAAQPGDTRSCERWAPMANGIMEGRSEARSGAGVKPLETMRIVVGVHGPVFHAEPKGQAAADFPAISVDRAAILFEDRAHDYPQRIRYWRKGAMLMAEISLADGSRPVRWTYRRVAR